MRRKWIGIVVLGLVMAPPARLIGAESPAAKSATPAVSAKKIISSADAEATKNATAEKVEKTPAQGASAVELELQHLKDLILEQSRELEAQRAAVRDQQQKIEALTEQLVEVRVGRETPAAAPALASNSPGSVEAVAQSQSELNNKVDKLQKDVEGKLKGFGPFRFSGDLRLRYEPFFGIVNSSDVVQPNRHRERFRLRLNADAKFNDEFSGGFSLASGDVGDPISTNQTMTGFFVRKPILIDKAFVTYSPHWYKPFQITAGKWAYTWYRTELTWDNDLNPEGVSEMLAYNWKNSFFQRFAVVAFQLNVAESSAGKDTAVFGEQVQTAFKLHDRVKLSAYGGFYNYRQPKAIAVAQVSGGLGSFNSGGLFSGSTNTNLTATLPSGSKGYVSRFALLDAIARLDVNTGISRFPLMLLLDFVQNTRACGNQSAFTTAPACNSKRRHGYWAEAQFGKTQEKGDIRFGYTFIRIERDAVVAAFNFSDLRQPTNVLDHRLEAYYQAYRNIQVGFTGLFGRQLGLVSGTSGPETEHFLRRLQFDLIYKF